MVRKCPKKIAQKLPSIRCSFITTFRLMGCRGISVVRTKNRTLFIFMRNYRMCVISFNSSPNASTTPQQIKKLDEDKTGDLKIPIELFSGIYEDSGAVAIEKTKDGGVRSVSWNFQKKEWEPTAQSVGSIMRQKPASAFDKERYGIKLTKEDKEDLKLKTKGIITTHDFFDKKGDVIYSKEYKTPKDTFVKLEIKIS